MNDFDKYLRKKAAKEKEEIPMSIKNNIEKTLASLPEKESHRNSIRLFPRFVTAAACLIFVALFLLPNISVVYAQTLEKVPVIGDIVQVVTIRNYFYSDTHHEMDIDVPKIEGTDNQAADDINKDVDELTKDLVDQFYKDLKRNGNNSYGAIHVDYENIMNTKRWFTLKISVTETAASSNQYYKYYHIDKSNGKIVKLNDLFRTDDFSDVIAKEIKKQMEQQMNDDESIKYWMNDSEIGKDFSSISNQQNFYWNRNGNLVIVFDKYEVGPGSMGTPEFVIKKNILKDIIKPEFMDINF